jgi:hypothetical protein
VGVPPATAAAAGGPGSQPQQPPAAPQAPPPALLLASPGSAPSLYWLGQPGGGPGLPAGPSSFDLVVAAEGPLPLDLGGLLYAPNALQVRAQRGPPVLAFPSNRLPSLNLRRARACGRPPRGGGRGRLAPEPPSPPPLRLEGRA